MGSALVGGLIRSGWAEAGECTVVEPKLERRELLMDRLPGVRTVPAPIECEDDVVLAVKPADAEAACRSLAPSEHRRVMSIVAGLPICRLESWLWPKARVVRAMPN